MTKQICLKHSIVSYKTLFFLFFLLSLTLALDYPSFNGLFTFLLQYLTVIGYQILDLTSKNIDSFYLETQKWAVSGLAGIVNSSLCGTNNPLLGGYGVFSNSAGMSKTYSALPTHTAIYYQITFNFIDKFKTPDYFTLALDSNSIAGGGSLKTYNSYVTSDICGGSDPDTTQFTIAGSMPHTAKTLAFQLTAKVSTGAGSGTLGIRDIQLTFVNDSSVTAATSCFRVFDSQLLGLSGECSCVKDSYLNSGTCTPCDSACQNCFGSSASQCYACASGYSFIESQCVQCDSSCLTCTGPDSLQCVTCQDGYWLQPDGSCTATCDLPASQSLTIGSFQLCYASCTTSQYLLWDGTCVNDCSSPLVISLSGGYELCSKPCENNEYLYSNGSCESTCPSPFISSSSLDVNLCQPPCTNSQFLYLDGSCSSKCPNPLVSSTPADGVKRCSSPCPNSSDYYYSSNDTCGNICSSPSVLQTVQFIQVCSVISTEGRLSSDDKNSVDIATNTIDAAGTATSVGIAASSLISSQSSGAITLISLIKMLEYIRYMNINYPPKLEYMMDSQGNDAISLTFNVNLPKSIERKFPDYPLPGRFGKYDLVSNFFVNYWEELFTLGVVLLVLVISTLLASKAKDVKYIGVSSTKIRDIIKWNFFLIVFCGNVDSVGVFSSMEFRTTHFNSFVSVFATLVCVFINLLVLYVMFMIPYIIYSLRRARRKVLPVGKNFGHQDYNAKNNSQRFALCGVLFMNFEEKSASQHSCMFLILFRVYLFNIIIGYLFEYPLVQAILLTTMSILMLGYFSIARPYKNALELIKTMTYETIIAGVNICVLILAIMDHKGIENNESRRKLGDAIIISNIAFNLMAVSYMVVELVIKVIKVYGRRKTITTKGWRYWLTITTFLLEPEELEMEEDGTPEKEEPVSQRHSKRGTKLEETPAKKSVSFKSQTPSDDQEGGQDSDASPLKISPSLVQRTKPTPRLSINKGGILKANSLFSFDGINDTGSRNLLTLMNLRPSVLLSQDHLSPRGNLLQNQEHLSVAPSPRMLLRGSNQFSLQDIENKFMNESVSAGTPVKVDDEKGTLLSKIQSYEVNSGQNKDRRRKMRPLGPSSVVLDHSGGSPDLSFEVGTGTLTALNTPRRLQSRFSRYSPEKSKILPEEEA